MVENLTAGSVLTSGADELECYAAPTMHPEEASFRDD